jgi:probable F420-dependent oxidoreductase
MHAHRPFRFGLQVPAGGSGTAWAEQARRAEALGFDTLLVPDHIGYPLWAYGPALTAAAMATTTLRICPFVLDNDFRHPAFVAAEAATLDQISDGRYELGIGAGWDLNDYQRTGIPFDPPGVRVERLEESIGIIKALFAGGPVSATGIHYQITDLEGHPKPVQHPHPPLLIGAGGKRMLALAAREADIVSVIMRARREGGLDVADGSAAAFDGKIAWLREQAGDRFDRLEINALIQRIVVTDHPDEHYERAASDFGMVGPEEGRDTPLALIGSIEQIIETIEQRRERWGISYLVVRPRYLDSDVLDDLGAIIARLAGR